MSLRLYILNEEHWHFVFPPEGSHALKHYDNTLCFEYKNLHMNLLMNVTSYIGTEIERKMRVASMWLLCLHENSMGLDRLLVSPVETFKLKTVYSLIFSLKRKLTLNRKQIFSTEVSKYCLQVLTGYEIICPSSHTKSEGKKKDRKCNN